MLLTAKASQPLLCLIGGPCDGAVVKGPQNAVVVLLRGRYGNREAVYVNQGGYLQYLDVEVPSCLTSGYDATPQYIDGILVWKILGVFEE